MSSIQSTIRGVMRAALSSLGAVVVGAFAVTTGFAQADLGATSPGTVGALARASAAVLDFTVFSPWFLVFLVGFFVPGGLYLSNYLVFLGKDEQLLVEMLTDRHVINGPAQGFLPLTHKSQLSRKASALGPQEYALVRNQLNGERKIVEGPTLYFLDAYEEIVYPAVRKVISLKATEYVRLLDEQTGKIRVEQGEQGRVVLGPYERALDTPANAANVGPQGVKTALYLKHFEYCRVLNKRTGQIRVERGDQLVFLGPYDVFLDGNSGSSELSGSSASEKRSVQTATEIDEETAVLVRNKRSGQQRLIGQLKQEKQTFVPSADEEILKVQKLIKLADYEACMVRGKDGADTFFFGSNPDQRSFFLPPHSELVKLLWSRGRRRETRDLVIQKIDLRPMYMSFEFNCRTADNVELILEGSFFWEIVDLKAMVKFTSDTSGDVCNHARSKFIEKVSKVTLQEFMADFNNIALAVHREEDGAAPTTTNGRGGGNHGGGSPTATGKKVGDTAKTKVDTTTGSVVPPTLAHTPSQLAPNIPPSANFYAQRGVLIHSLEVTGYRCASPSTAAILEQIIQETTNRMNRLQQQESENEVQLHQIRGDIEEERARKELLEVQIENSNARSEMEGLAEAERVKAFMEGLSKLKVGDGVDGKAGSFEKLPLESRIALWNVLRKTDALNAISNGEGNARFYYTPNDVNLSIETREGAAC